MLGSWGINSELASSMILGSFLPFDTSAHENVTFYSQLPIPHSLCDASQQVESLCQLVYPLESIAIALLAIWMMPHPLVRDMQHAMEARRTWWLRQMLKLRIEIFDTSLRLLILQVEYPKYPTWEECHSRILIG